MGQPVEGMEQMLAEHEKTLKATRKVIQGIEKQLRLHMGMKDVEIRKDLTAWKKAPGDRRDWSHREQRSALPRADLAHDHRQHRMTRGHNESDRSHRSEPAT